MAMADNDGAEITYGELCRFVREFSRQVPKRTLIFILCKNNVASASAYIAALSNRVVPLLLNENLDNEFIQNLVNIYQPEFVWAKSKLEKTGQSPHPMHDDLSLLLPTSGSTGSPKLVRHSYRNIEASASNVSKFFSLDESERAMLQSPIYNTYGLSILTSHIYAGAAALLTTGTVLSRDYWDLFKAYKATSISGVPYTYEMLKKLRFFGMSLPSLRTLSQGGGRLSDGLFAEYAEYAEKTGIRFTATYGQTESTARMTGLQPEYAAKKNGSIGKAIPGGEISLVEDTGEIVYRGPNVTMGYAQTGSDLIKGDERGGILYTGDIAEVDEDGFLYIIGRKSRFLKLFGIRIGLDESERLIKSKFNTDCACVGDDSKMRIFITDASIQREAKDYMAEKTGINPAAFEIIAVNALPRNESGKILYGKLGDKTCKR